MKTTFEAKTRLFDRSGRPGPAPGTGIVAGSPASVRGVALVITLIMLSVITFMAVTFLVLSHRERGSVSTSTDQANARLTADTATARALSELLARIMTYTNDQDFGLCVSTNFINYAGFDPLAADYRTNVNYDYLRSGAALNLGQRLQNLTNLLIDPRPPVIVTNPYAASGQEFRYYLDLNRNGAHEVSGLWPEISPYLATPYYHTNRTLMGNPDNFVTLSNFFMGDPEWIGVLEYPGQQHSGDNRFVARYAYIVQPAGKVLDVNYIYNDAKRMNMRLGEDGFFRNQGVGSWEINLAAFLLDLNTNYWNPFTAPYIYDTSTGNRNRGKAFDDALSILNYRYRRGALWGPNTLANVGQMFGANGVNAFVNDQIDGFTDGPLMTGRALPLDTDANSVSFSAPWPGADNPNHFFTPQELLDATKISFAFPNSVIWAGTNIDSYNRYTFYRMMAQLGTDAAPAEDKINVNYANVNASGAVVPGMETNYWPWDAQGFFTAAADRLLRTNTTIWSTSPSPVDRDAYFITFGVTNAFGITNIPIYGYYVTTTNIPDVGLILVTNAVHGYTPGVHRLLQVAANIYDATTNRFRLQNNTNELQAPTVFRPIFRRNPGPVATNVFIVGYREVVNTALIPQLRRSTVLGEQLMLDMDSSADRSLVPPLGTPFQGDNSEVMVAGIPLVIGAKEGFPNFNKFALQNSVTLTRKLNFRRPRSGGPVNQTNQMHMLSISNRFGAQLWNSYQANFTRPLQVWVAGEVLLALTNQFGQIRGPDGFILTRTIPFYTNFPVNAWSGYDEVRSADSASFIGFVLTNYLFLPTNSAFQIAQNRFYYGVTNDGLNNFPVPRWWLYLKTRMRCAVVDTTASPNRLLDYVNLSSGETPLNIIELMRAGAPCGEFGSFSTAPVEGSLWCTNRLGYPNLGAQPAAENLSIPTYGVLNQILVSLGSRYGGVDVGDDLWRQYSAQVQDRAGAQEAFFNRLFSDATTDKTDPAFHEFGTPFNPSTTFYQNIRWEANDPLVHYTVPDLTDLLGDTNVVQYENDNNPVRRLKDENPIADHYRPWGGHEKNGPDTSIPTKVNTAVKDPGATNSDAWNFPTNKLPNIGWLGRVHRGSPWQTVYLKSTDDTNQNYWMWSGNANRYDALYMGKPTNDRLLFEIFTAALNENATKGQLSVNQTNLAAWSAVLSEVTVLTNSPAGDLGWTTIQPAGIYGGIDPAQWPPLVRIVEGINRTRANTDPKKGSVFPNFVFNRLGDILATPELTERSPYLDRGKLLEYTAGGITDDVMERIPQQIMSLLTFSQEPRFVIYSFGQTLKPADRSIYPGSGPLANLCTNYQITAETATRTVVRIEGGAQNPRPVVEQFNILPLD